MSTTTTSTTAIAACPNCLGVGEDPDFGGRCDCAYWVAKMMPGLTDLNRMLVGEVAFTASERVRSHVGGGNAHQHGPVANTNGATEKQVAFLHKLLAERLASGVVGEEATMQLARIDAASDHPMSKRGASEYIDMMMAMKRQRGAATSAAAKPARSNARPQRCEKCGVMVEAGVGSLENVNGRWVVAHVGECPAAPAKVVDAKVTDIDLRPLERFTSRGLVRVAVPGGDTRLKLRVKFNNGVVYVDDAAEYGEGRNYGRQVGATYVGDAAEALRAIVADPQAAIIAYTELVGRCGICNRHLEDKTSVAQGIGPRCAKKLGL